MAQRYGGEYSRNTSPHSKRDQKQHSNKDGQKRPQKEGKRRRKMVAKATGRSNALFIPKNARFAQPLLWQTQARISNINPALSYPFPSMNGPQRPQ